LIFETGFIENACAFGYILGDLEEIEERGQWEDGKRAHTEGSWPVPIGMRQKS
jgi:hypothetical protein